MLYFSKWNIGFIICVCLMAVAFSLPNIIEDPEETLGSLGQYTVNPGLDLRGGSYLLLEVDTQTYLLEQIDNLKSEVRGVLRGKTIDNKRIRYTGGLRTKDGKVALTLTDPSISSGVVNLIQSISNEIEVIISPEQPADIYVGYTQETIDKMQRQVLEQSIEIVRRRVDETGTREPDIQRSGDNRILLQVPGLDDPEYLKGLLGKTAKMTFHLLDNTMPYPDMSKKPVPPGSVRLPTDEGDSFFTIKRRAVISGDLLNSAKSSFDQTGQPVVDIAFNNLGAKKFGDITKKHIGKPFAIVLDNKILTAPVIRAVILDGRAQISGSFTPQTAADLALLLRAGSLPAPLNIIEERTVGPSLGADSIEAGAKAMIIGLILVVVFMALNYGLFGIFANIALLVNIILVVAILSIFGATLTLPGIAGIVLTLGMAVDANVLIFERIREEVRLGKTVMAATDNGFRQAFKTIFDANITTLIAAIILFNFGSGPIKGFAVTLSTGIITSMFSAILLTRLMVAMWVLKKKPSQLPI